MGFARYLYHWGVDHPYRLVFIGGLATILGSALVVIGGLLAGKQQAKSSQDRLTFERDMRLQTTEAINSITGGDNFPIFGPMRNKLSPESLWSFYINNGGKYPIYDIQVVFEDLTARAVLMDRDIKLRGFPTTQSLEQTRTVLQVGNIPPGQGNQSLYKIQFADSLDEQRYVVSISARNGLVHQDIIFRKLPNGEWRYARQVTTNPNRSQAVEVQDDFPRRKTGEPEWLK